jgi:hypothetical protein
VPSAHIDGASTASSQEEIDQHAAVPSFIKIEGTAVATEGVDLDVEITVTAYEDYPNTTIHIAIVEDEYTNTAGTNGESEFFQVLRKMLPDANGTAANLSNSNAVTVNESASFETGDVTANSFRLWEGLHNCRVIVFVQDENTKQVLHSELIEITGSFVNVPSWEDLDIQLMPNPAKENLSISLNPKSQNLHVTILSMTGQKVQETNYGVLDGEQLLSLDVSDFPTGFYTLKVQLDDKTSIHRFIKQ